MEEFKRITEGFCIFTITMFFPFKEIHTFI